MILYVILDYLYYASPLSCILGCNILYYAGPLSCILGCNLQGLSYDCTNAILRSCHCHSNRTWDLFIADLTQVCCSCLIIFHCSFRDNDLTATGAISLARVLQHNKSLEELKWVIDWFDWCFEVKCKCCKVKLPHFTKMNCAIVALSFGCWIEWNTVIILTRFLLLLLLVYLTFPLFSLDLTDYQWTGIGDDGAIALANPRVMKYFKTLE